MPLPSWRSHVFITVVGALAFLTTGCETFNEKSGNYRQSWEHGQYQAAAAQVTEKANACVLDKNGERPLKDWDKDSTVFLLEQGAILRTAEQLEASNTAFERVDRKIQAIWNRPEIELATETMAILNNQTEFPYDGYAYDHVMARTYMALNYLQLGKPLAARERLIAAENAQNEYLAKRSEKIAKQQAQLQKEKPQAQIDPAKVTTNANGQSNFAEVDNLVTKYAAYTNYRNPFSTWLYGLYMMAAPAANQDPGYALTAMKLVAGMAPNNKTVQADLADATSGKPLPPTTYVIFETGLAPIRDEFVLWLPIPTGNHGQITPMKLAFPRLIPRETYLSALPVTANGVTYHTETLASMDGIIAREFKDQLPLVITRTIISASVKTAGTAVAAHGAGNYGGLVTIVGAVAQEVTTRADLRQWATLPKEFQVCRIPTPANRTLTLNLLSGPLNLQLPEGNVHLVYVKSINPQTPPIVWQAKLN